MSSPRILCLGEMLFDLLSDQPGRPLAEVTSWTAYPGGAPANVACALTKLGTPTAFLGCLGKDDAGETLVDLLTSIGVDVSGVQRHDTAPTREIYVVRAENGDRQFAGFGDRASAEFSDTHLLAEKLPVELFEHADFLVLGTLEMAYPDTRAATERAIALAEQHFIKIVVDVNWRPMFWDDLDAAKAIIHQVIQKADFLKLSAEEADWLFETRDPSVIAHRLDSVEGVLITDGENGCSYALSGNEGQLPAYAVEVKDTTGAGDSFVAGFLHQLAQKGIQSIADPITARQIVTYASAVGALTTMQPGAIAAQPTPAEVDTFLSTHAT